MSHTTNGFLRRFSVRFASFAFVAAGLLLATRAAVATPLLINATIPATNTPGTLGGTFVASTGPLPITSATFSGTLTSSVFVNDPANPFGASAGFFTFKYLLTNNASSPDTIDRLAVPGYGLPGLLTDASYSTLAPGIAPTLFTRDSGLGDVIGANFFPPNALSPGTTSELIVIHTSANQDRNSVASIIDGSTAQVLTLAPLFVGGGPPSPEPSTLVLSILGFAGLGAVVRRRLHRNV